MSPRSQGMQWMLLCVGIWTVGTGSSVWNMLIQWARPQKAFFEAQFVSSSEFWNRWPADFSFALFYFVVFSLLVSPPPPPPLQVARDNGNRGWRKRKGVYCGLAGVIFQQIFQETSDFWKKVLLKNRHVSASVYRWNYIYDCVCTWSSLGRIQTMAGVWRGNMLRQMRKMCTILDYFSFEFQLN